VAKRRKLSKKKIVISIVIIFIVLFAAAFARYMLTQNNNFYGKTKEFYFNSDKLSENCPLYRIENWPGVDDYMITINVNSNQNNILSASYDINYAISYTCSDNVLCELSKETRYNSCKYKL